MTDCLVLQQQVRGLENNTAVTDTRSMHCLKSWDWASRKRLRTETRLLASLRFTELQKLLCTPFAQTSQDSLHERAIPLEHPILPSWGIAGGSSLPLDVLTTCFRRRSVDKPGTHCSMSSGGWHCDSRIRCNVGPIEEQAFLGCAVLYYSFPRPPRWRQW